MSRRLSFRAAPACLAAGLLLSACARAPDYDGPRRVGSMPPAVRESSGLAPSRLDPAVVWTHNDSGGQPVLYALGPTGNLRGSVRIAGAVNRDWEDLASFELDGRSWLLVADTGDNGAKRSDCELIVIEEPSPAALAAAPEITVPPAWRVPVRYPGGPRDCESVAVDARAGLVYLLAKRVLPRGLYTLPLRLPAGAPAPEARIAAWFPEASIPAPTATQSLLPIPSGRFRAQPTSMDFASDGSAAVVLSYGDVMLFPRKRGESWADALLRPPMLLNPHGLTQAEGVCFGADNRTIYVSSEGAGSTFVRYKAGD